jgi:Flp pilus assembly protein TadG
MLTRRVRPQAGAAALLVTMLMGALMTGGLGAVDTAASVAAQSRADNAADAVAHAAASVLAADPDRDQLSIAVQAAGGACDGTAQPAGSTGPACPRALATARQAALDNNAVLLRLTVGPDLRDDRADRGAGRLVTLALVAVRRGLPVLPARCPDAPGTGPDLCWAEAWSAAQEAG